jgi:hypothetical protein
VSDIQRQLALQNRLLQSIKDELAGVKRALAVKEASREERFNAALAKLRSEFDMDRLDVIAAEVATLAGMAGRDSLRIQAIMRHLGLPDVKLEGAGGEPKAR